MKTAIAMLAVTATVIAMATGAVAVGASAPEDMALVPAGAPPAFFVPGGSGAAAGVTDRGASVEVPAFLIDRRPVTRRQFADFLRRRPAWSRSRVAAVLVDTHYLEDWASDFDAGTRVPPDAPVTRVSWFAANAYCEWRGKEVPTVAPGGGAAAGGGKDTAATRDRILRWYSRPGTEPLGVVGRGAPNAYGVYDLHGLIWEWTLDFNSTLISTESRDPGGKDDPLFCGSGSLGAADPSDYPTFMRYALRNSLKANYTTSHLGFRCAREPGTP